MDRCREIRGFTGHLLGPDDDGYDAARAVWNGAIDRLSHGTAEQVYLLRLALAEHLCATGESAPLLLDDVTVQADGDRARGMLELLHALSAERQVVLFSQEHVHHVPRQRRGKPAVDPPAVVVGRPDLPWASRPSPAACRRPRGRA